MSYLDINQFYRLKHKNSGPVYNNQYISMEFINRDIQEKLDCFHRTNRIPHIIFHGESGSGKKTTVFQFIKKIYHGNETNIKNNVMFVNCAHGKGIKFIREELKFFAKTNVHFKSGIWFKIIVLINADYLTVDAQSALRRCIEQFSNNTRFFIVIENKNKLLTPIVSRFCEIYVPLLIENGNQVNLHTKKIEQSYGFSKLLFEQSIRQMDTIMNSYETPTYIDLLQMVDQIYNQGLSAFDFIEWIQQQSTLTPLQKSTMQMYFSKVRLEYRCEKLLLLCLLFTYFFNPDIDLKTLSFM